MARALAPIVFSLALGLALGPATRAAAGTLATPAVGAKDGEFVECTLVNVGTKAVREALAELISYDSGVGVVLASSGAPADLAPNGKTVTTGPAGPGFDPFVCRFTFKGSGKLLRGNAIVIDGTFDVLDTQPAF